MTLEQLAASNILVLARALAAAKGISLAGVSSRAHGDSEAFDKLEALTGSMTLRKYDASMAFLRDRKNWPEGATVPKVWEPWLTTSRKGGWNG